MRRFISVLMCIIMIVLSFPFVQANAEGSADEQAEQIFKSLAGIYNNALSYLEHLYKSWTYVSANPTADPDWFWFSKAMGIDDVDTYLHLYNSAKTLNPYSENSETEEIYDSLFVPLISNGFVTEDVVFKAIMTLNHIVFRDENMQSDLEAQKTALRGLKAEYPDYPLLKELQTLYKETAKLVDYVLEDTLIYAEAGSKYAEFKEKKRDLKAEFDLDYDWPDQTGNPGSVSSWIESYHEYHRKQAEKKAEREAAEKAAQEQKEKEKAEEEAMKQSRDAEAVEKTSAVRVQMDHSLAAMVEIGTKTVFFGRFEQDADSGNGLEKIEWIVLDVQDGKCLLLSRYSLDCHSYHDGEDIPTWEVSSLRKWLNSDFLQLAFSDEEQAVILETDVDNSSAQGFSGWHVDGGDNTRDKVFLLSYAETEKYFPVKDDKMCAPTDYAIKQGAVIDNFSSTVDGRKTWNWWLRSPGQFKDRPAIIGVKGRVTGNDAKSAGGVRPALWLNLNPGISE